MTHTRTHISLAAWAVLAGVAAVWAVPWCVGMWTMVRWVF